MDKPHEVQVMRHELFEQRQELHGKRRRLHERLSTVCEEFVAEDLSRDFKRSALARELQYLLDYYHDDASWEGVE
jgi:hypothetical protein